MGVGVGYYIYTEWICPMFHDSYSEQQKELALAKEKLNLALERQSKCQRFVHDAAYISREALQRSGSAKADDDVDSAKAVVSDLSTTINALDARYDSFLWVLAIGAAFLWVQWAA